MKITDLSILCKWENLKNRVSNTYLPPCIYIRGVTVHKIHGSVRYDTVVSRFGTFSIQQKERNDRNFLDFYISFIYQRGG